jgi:hypothetical protein
MSDATDVRRLNVFERYLNRCAAFMNACSASWPWRASPSTLDCRSGLA